MTQQKNPYWLKAQQRSKQFPLMSKKGVVTYIDYILNVKQLKIDRTALME